jgi:AraC-like DNA-binding protein
MIHAFTLQRYLELMRLRGFEAEAVLSGTGVDPQRVQDRGYLIDAERRRAVIGNMIQLAGSAALGFEFGRQLRISQLGAVGHVLVSSHSIAEQYDAWVRYAQTLLGVQIGVGIRREASGAWTVDFHDPNPPGPEHVFCVEEILMIASKMAQSLSGEPIHLVRVSLDYPAPPHAALYTELLQCPVEFGGDCVEMTADTPQLDEMFPTQDEELARTCRSYCGRLLEEMGAAQPIAARLRNMLAMNLGDLPSIEAAAKALGMSERTLRRRLAEEGTGFQEVLSQFRCETAVDYLRSQRMKPKEIAYLLGFRHPTDFRRAFKAWTGQNIGQFMNGIEQRESA